MAGALAGLRVIECGEGVPAAYAAKLFADLGADVLKIEEPARGDITRTRGPFPGDEPHPEKSGLFLYLNANKRGAAVDLTHPRGREVLARLVDGADLLIHNVPPARMAEAGLVFEEIHRRNPRLIMTSISPFGQTGPYRDYHAYELTSTNAGGWAWLIDPDVGDPSLPPLKAFGEQCQYQTGLNAAAASLGALIARDLHGVEGQHIDVSVQECVTTFLEMNFIHYTYGGRIATRYGQRIIHPWSMLQAKDGLVFLICVEEDQWQRLVEWMGSPEWATWEVFADRIQRAANWDVLRPLIEEWTAARGVEELYRGGLERRIPFAPVSLMADLLANDHLRAREFFVKMAHPEAGALEYPGAPWKLSATPWELRGPAPLLGQHTDEALAAAGYGAGEIARLRDEGAI
jgi:crotonobetainyl-CoA:carnitine CoA-transferase CaiB-like acyl-CoA transferase